MGNYNKANIFYAVVISIFISLNFSCVYQPTEPEEITHTFSYQVEIPAMDQDSLHITFTINNWEYGDSVHIMAPPMYADNPILKQTGINFHNLQITDPGQNPVSYSTDSLSYGIFRNLMVSFLPTAFPTKVEYDVTFLYEEHKYMPQPQINDNAGYLQGNYLFAIPCLSKDMVEIWRAPCDIYVTYTLGDKVNLFGDPPYGVSIDTPYELLFSTSVILSSSVKSSQLLFEGMTSGQAFRFVNISSTTTFTEPLLDSVKNNFITILNDMIPNFGIIDEVPFTVITGFNDKIGLEGMFAFCLRNPKEGDTKGVLNMTMAHELAHSWVGVRVGDYDDPWWKEGTATYLGLLIPKRNGLCTREYIQETLLDTFAGITAVEKYAISDPRIRPIIYTSPDGVATIIYRKGGQVCMLLDRYIREVSQNTTTFDEILAAFVKQFDGNYFHRNDYVSFLNRHSGGTVEDIFRQYVDTPGIIPYSVLLENFNALENMGAFGD